MEGTTLDDAFNMAPLGMQAMPVAAEPQPQPKQSRKSTPISAIRKEMYQDAPQVQQEQPTPVMYDPRDNLDRHVQRIAQVPIQHPTYVQAPQQSSYFDTMVTKRRDVVKMISFAVIILLAISIHTVVDFGLKEFIISGDFTFNQEIGLRLIYPVAVLFLLWNLKALTGR